MKRKYIFSTVLVALVIAGVFYLYGGGQTPSGQLRLQNVTASGAGQIKSEFNAARDEARVLLLLSPT